MAGRGQVVFTTPASPFTPANCADTAFNMLISWGMDPAGTVPQTGWTYRILASTTNQCTYVASPSNVVAANIVPTAITSDGLIDQRYPKVGSSDTLTLDTFRAAAQTTCAAGPTIYACVQLVRNDTDGTVASQTGTVKLAIEIGPPSIPIITGVQPGQNALIVSWRDGTDSTVAAATYTLRILQKECVTAPTSAGCALDPNEHALNTTSNTKSARVEGLVVGLEYQVLLYANSGGGLASAASAPAYGTPIDVKDFWALYGEANGPEKGGCGGGAAGLLSLLAVAGLARSLRRRS
jgi:hypothetical protein